MHDKPSTWQGWAERLAEELMDALPYVPDCFREKWGYDEVLDAFSDWKQGLCL
jgi:hypothetical protein